MFARSPEQLPLPWISSAEGFRAKTSRSQASALVLLESVPVSGSSSCESSRTSPPPLSSSRTCSDCERPDCLECWPTLPLSGSMRSGRISALQSSAARTFADVSSSLLPTPSASSYGTNRGGSSGRVGKLRPSLDTLLSSALLPTPLASTGGGTFGRGNPKLESILRSALLPTPTVCGDWNRRGASPQSGDGLGTVAGSSIILREWMMGFPRGWTWVARERRSATRSPSPAPKSSDARS